MANRPILQNIMNAALSGVRAMPSKDSSADNSSEFACDRAQYYRSYDSNPVPLNKKWMGSRDASDVARRRRTNGVAIGSFNANGETMSFATKETLTANRALQRARSGGAIVPLKVSKKMGYYVPGAPTDLQIDSVGNGSLTLSFVAPASNGNAAIIGYKYTLDGGNTFSSIFTENPFTINGLNNGDTYEIQVVAVNRVGDSVLSTGVSGSPYTVPGAPDIINAVAGVGAATISFDAPTDNGGSPILSYIITSNPSGFSSTYTVTQSTSYPASVTISGLTNGTSYIFDIVATNLAGSGDAATSSSVTPSGVPTAPIGLSATPGDRQIILSFTAPTSSGGSAITNYAYSFDGTNYTEFSTPSTVSPVIITGLSVGTSYTVYLKAKNENGLGAASGSATATTKNVPTAPTGLSATSTSSSISVSFTQGPDGGSAITNYSYSTDGINYTTRSPESTTSPIVISGLNANTSYTVRIKAINNNGSSMPSESTTISTTSGVPDAPTGLSVSSDDQTLTISFTQGSNGGSAITNYAYSTDGTNYTDFSPVDTTSPVTITSLTNGQSYTIYLKAKNASGYSAASSSITGTPNLIPDTIRTALSTNQSNYDTASNGSWVKITAAEYANLHTTIASSTKVAASDTIINAAASGGINNTGNAFVANHKDPVQSEIPANSYLYAFAVRWSSKTPKTDALVYINNTSANYTGFSSVGGYLPNLVGGNPASFTMATNYYVFKKPQNASTANGAMLGFFTGMNNIDGYTSGWLLGQVERTVGATIRPGRGFHYAINTPAEPTSSTVMNGALTGPDNYAVGMQGLSTTVKQW